MLKIRPQQREIVRDALLSDLALRIAEHVRECLPDQAKLLGGELPEVIEHTMQRALAHGFVAELLMVQYVDLAIYFGRDFDVDPEHPWAQEALSIGAEDESPWDRMERLYDAAIEAIEANEEQARLLDGEG